jgi:hypothetical protein
MTLREAVIQAHLELGKSREEAAGRAEGHVIPQLPYSNPRSPANIGSIGDLLNLSKIFVLNA